MAEYIVEADCEYSDEIHQVIERIVRCKDCDYCDDSDCFRPAAMFCVHSGLFFDDTDGFCSWGERR